MGKKNDPEVQKCVAANKKGATLTIFLGNDVVNPGAIKDFADKYDENINLLIDEMKDPNPRLWYNIRKTKGWDSVDPNQYNNPEKGSNNNGGSGNTFPTTTHYIIGGAVLLVIIIAIIIATRKTK
jgi:hypothetical protein